MDQRCAQIDDVVSRPTCVSPPRLQQHRRTAGPPRGVWRFSFFSQESTHLHSSPAVHKQACPGQRAREWRRRYVHVQQVLLLAGAFPLKVRHVQECQRRRRRRWKVVWALLIGHATATLSSRVHRQQLAKGGASVGRSKALRTEEWPPAGEEIGAAGCF